MNKSGGSECLAWTWGIAILVGCVTAAVLWGLGGWSFMQGVFMGVLCLLILGALLTLMMCRGSSGQAQTGSTGASGTTSGSTAGTTSAAAAAETASDDTAAVAQAEADAAARAEADAAARAEAAAAAQAEADAAAQAEADAAAQAEADAAAAQAEADAATRAEAAAAAKAQADADAAAANAQAEADAAAAQAASADAAPAAAATAEDEGEGSRPEALDGPRNGVADDLKRIKGVGPKMETLCNSLGFYHFDQIAAWTPDEVRWVDQNLKGFKGRVTRDAWVEQARLLAEGGETEFSKKVDDGNVY